MISVAMAIYNGERYIVDQLKSIYNQSLEADEVIICDDCSSDNTVDIVNNFIKKNKLQGKWHLIRNEENMGYINNFVKAISLTKGDYIFLSDQDDIFYPEKFEIMITFMEKHGDCVLLNAGYEIIDEYSNRTRTLRARSQCKRKKYKKLTFEKWLKESAFPGFSMCMRKGLKDILLKANMENCYGHDQMIGLLAIGQNGNYEISKVLSGYRVHYHNITGGKNISENYSIDLRIEQKKKELEEYQKLFRMIKNNNIKYTDISFLERRQSDLKKRISALETKNWISVIKIILFCQTYPKRTLLGDLIYLLRVKI